MGSQGIHLASELSFCLMVLLKGQVPKAREVNSISYRRETEAQEGEGAAWPQL